MTPADVERFLSKIEKTAHCWEWRAHRNPNGYGSIQIDGRQQGAHRVAFEMLGGGVIPDGYHVDHLCRNRGCVNPDHLEAVTPRENYRRGLGNERAVTARATQLRSRTACSRGHEYTPATLRWSKEGWRRCLACSNARQRIARSGSTPAVKARQKAATAPKKAHSRGGA